jgi:hypothetical protein
MSLIQQPLGADVFDLGTLPPVSGERMEQILAEVTAAFNDNTIPYTSFDAIQTLFNDLVKLGIKKDSEYGASWCRRKGPGAFFTIWRKIDRLETQCDNRKFDIFNVDDDPTSTESLDETFKDAIFYFALVLEKRQAKRAALAELAHAKLLAEQLQSAALANSMTSSVTINHDSLPQNSGLSMHEKDLDRDRDRRKL